MSVLKFLIPVNKDGVFVAVHNLLVEVVTSCWLLVYKDVVDVVNKLQTFLWCKMYFEHFIEEYGACKGTSG